MVRRAAAPELTRADWVKAGLEALAEGGVEAVRIEVLARALAVTKGSFYWHFADRRALLESMAAHWATVATTDVIAAVEARGGDGATRLRRLIAICFRAAFEGASGRGVPVDRLENALRQWGSTDDAVRPILAKADAARLAYVAGLLVDAGLSLATARSRSRILYLAMIGEFAWTSHGGAATRQKTLADLADLLLSLET